MFLFIFESIGTSELLLIAVVALIFLGPRRMPEMARKAAKIMAEFRSATNEFKQTWEREVNFEEESKAFRNLDVDETPIPRENTIHDPAIGPETPATVAPPEIRQVDPAVLQGLQTASSSEPQQLEHKADTPDINDKRNWL